MLETGVFMKPSCRSCGPVVAVVAIPAAVSVFLADLQSARYKLPWQQLPPLQIINTVHRNRAGRDQFNRRSFSKCSPLKHQEFLGNVPVSKCYGEPCHSTTSAFHLSRAKHLPRFSQLIPGKAKATLLSNQP